MEVELKKRHGHSIKGKVSLTYSSWYNAKHRVKSNRPGVKEYYKDKNLEFYEPWNDFLVFLKEVGRRPSKRHSLDRIDPSKGYVPGNVRWQTSRIQNLNKKRYKNGSSKYKGVSYRPKSNKTNPWYASISVKGKQINLGHFSNELDAAKAYDKAALKFNKEFAVVNFPEEVAA